MARPRSDRVPKLVWNVKLLLYSPEDDDLIRVYRSYVEGTRNGADVVKAAMRSGSMTAIASDDSADDEVFEALDGLVM